MRSLGQLCAADCQSCFQQTKSPPSLRLTGHHSVLGKLLYGTGMRINEALQLRVKDIDFAHRAIVIREAKGFKDRVWKGLGKTDAMDLVNTFNPRSSECHQYRNEYSPASIARKP
jgi:site-specific recombinase XerD